MNIKELEIRYKKTSERVVTHILNNPKAVVAYIQSAIAQRPDQEQLWVILLDTRLKAMGRYLCHLGTVSKCLCHPSDIFRPAILAAASRIIVVHNHPSGDPEPSSEDIALTEQLDKCGQLLGIPLLDHMVIGQADDDPLGVGHYSFSDAECILNERTT